MSTGQKQPGRITIDPSGRPVITGPWPTYVHFSQLPLTDRLDLYRLAKESRAALERQGFAMSEPYEAFVRRVTEELCI